MWRLGIQLTAGTEELGLLSGLGFFQDLREFQLGFRQGLGKHLLDFLFFQVLGHGQFGDEEKASPFQHLLFPEGKGLALVEKQEAFQDGSDFEERSRPHLLGILLKPVLPIGVAGTLAVGEVAEDLLDFAVPNHPPKANAGDVLKRDHDLQTTGLNLEEVEPLDRFTNGPAADLLDNPNAMVRVNDFVTYVESEVTMHWAAPAGAG